MIKILSKPKKEYNDLETYAGVWDLLKDMFPRADHLFYFEKDGKEFMYIEDLYSFVIPKESSGLTVKDILGDHDIDTSNWTLTKISQEVPYILNHLKYGAAWSEDSYHPIPVEDLTGTWILKDENVEIKFSIKQELCEWDNGRKNYYFGFPEKTVIPRDSALINRKTCFIANLLWKKLQ